MIDQRTEPQVPELQLRITNFPANTKKEGSLTSSQKAAICCAVGALVIGGLLLAAFADQGKSLSQILSTHAGKVTLLVGGSAVAGLSVACFAILKVDKLHQKRLQDQESNEVRTQESTVLLEDEDYLARKRLTESPSSSGSDIEEVDSDGEKSKTASQEKLVEESKLIVTTFAHEFREYIEVEDIKLYIKYASEETVETKIQKTREDLEKEKVSKLDRLFKELNKPQSGLQSYWNEKKESKIVRETEFVSHYVTDYREAKSEDAKKVILFIYVELRSLERLT